MNANRVMLGVLAAVAAVAVFALVPARSAEEGETAAPSAAAPAGEKMEMPMKDHMKCMAEMKTLLQEAKAAVQANEADKAVEKIDAALALVAKKHEEMHKCMEGCCKAMMEKMEAEADPAKKAEMEKKMKEMKCPMCMPGTGAMDRPAADGMCVNSACPIMGTKLDPANVPESLTRMYKGKKVGFCCPGCPGAWDKLTDEEKQGKLDKATAEPKAE